MLLGLVAPSNSILLWFYLSYSRRVIHAGSSSRSVLRDFFFLYVVSFFCLARGVNDAYGFHGRGDYKRLGERNRERNREREREITLFFPFSFFGSGNGLIKRGKGGGGVGRRQVHSLATLQVLALIHGQATSATAEAVSFRAELATVAHFAK